jgi:hypothetical protein
MAFFDKKEEVLNIELTQMGKLMLSRGKFTPHSYAFFDDNILYDGEYSGIVEEPREVQERVQNTPQRKTQYCFTSLERQVKELTELIRTKKASYMDDIVQNYQEREYALNYMIGTSEYNNEKYPSWKVNFLRGRINSIDSNITSAQQVVKIPQINVKPVLYKTRIFPGELAIDEGEQQISPARPLDGGLGSVVYADGSYVEVFQDYLFLDVLEENTEFLNENVMLEVFLVEDVDEQGKVVNAAQAQNIETKEKLTPLSFVKKQKNVVDGFLLDDDEMEAMEKNPVLDASFVEYWFDIFVDEQISRDVICQNKPSKEIKGNVFTQDDEVCPDNPRTNFRLIEDLDRIETRRQAERGLLMKDNKNASISGRRLFPDGTACEEGEEE